VEKEILRTAIGEVTRTGDVASDDKVLTVLRKLVKANQETMRAATDPEQQRVLEQEIGVLEGFLPRAPSAAELAEMLGPVAAEIRAAAGPGPAQGIAMKFFKAQGTSVDGAGVRDAVTRLRESA
jgi:uncharacterized protein YqeY